VIAQSSCDSRETRWPAISCAMILGYLCMGRSFAYWGIPQWNLFVGEVVLGCFLIIGPMSRNGRWPWAGMRLPRLGRLTFWMLASLGYGIFQVIRGTMAGNSFLTSARDLGFNYYPFYLFLGIWAGSQRPERTAAYARTFAWVNGIYGCAFVLFLTRVGWMIPGTSQQVNDVPLFGQPEHSGLAILALLAMEPHLRKSWHLLLMNSFVLLGMQIRAAWLAFLLALFLWGFLTRRVGRLLWGATAVAVLLGVMYVADLRLVGPQGSQSRGGSFSAREIVSRALAPVNPDIAASYGDNADIYEKTAVWRTIWWAAIWSSVHADSETAVLGHGYGYALGDLVPYLEGTFIRTPHSVFFYALGYGGWAGVGLFALFQFELVRLLAAVRRLNGQTFGLICWFSVMVYASFTAAFEVPYGAIPFYLIIGWTIAPLLGSVPIAALARHGPPASARIAIALLEPGQ
jgi:hypothetical protein